MLKLSSLLKQLIFRVVLNMSKLPNCILPKHQVWMAFAFKMTE